jgi:anthranilate synthase component 2
VNPLALPHMLTVTSYSAEGHIMSIKHKEFDVHGVQFHPESYMTPLGKNIMKNFLSS